MSGLPAVTEHGKRHCATCACPAAVVDLTVYPPNAVLYGTCETCGQPFWEVVAWDYRRAAKGDEYEPTRHCGCCTHEHREPGGYTLPRRPKVIA